jgi:hypothetical protein
MSTTDSSEEMPGERMDRRQRMVLYMLFRDSFPWTVEEMGRELGDHGQAADAIAELATDGLVHRFEVAALPGREHVEFVIPTRTARRSDELYEGAM